MNMKISIEITPARRKSLLLALLTAAVLCLMGSLPYFRYGSETKVYTPLDGVGRMLPGSWVLSGKQPGEEGYEVIKVTGEKTMEHTRFINGATVTENGKVAYNDRTGALKFTFIDKTVLETPFAVSLSFGGIREMPVMGYLAYPNASDEFTEDITSRYAAAGLEFAVNRAIIAPLFEFVLLCVGLVLCLLMHRNIFCAIVPFAASLAADVTFLTNRLLSFGLPQPRIILIIAFFILAVASLFRLRGLVLEKRERYAQNAAPPVQGAKG
jgi:hypothetical protein